MSDIVNRAFFDRSERKFTFARVQDVEPILEQNKELRSYRQESDFCRHKATIPNVLIEKWLHEELDKGNVTLKLDSEEFERLIDRKLKDPDYAYLLTASAQVQGFMGFGS